MLRALATALVMALACCLLAWNASGTTTAVPPYHPSFESLPTPPCTIVINSCSKYASTTLPGLLDSLRAAGVPGECVCVVIGASDPPAAAPFEYAWTHRAVEVDYTWLDLTGMVAISRDAGRALVGTPWVLYLHDTSRVGPRFWGMYKKMFWDMHDRRRGGCGVDAHMLIPVNSMNIGFYRTAWVRGLDLQEHMHRPEESQAIKNGGIEDAVFHMTRNKSHMTPVEEHVPGGCHRYAADGIRRRVEYYPALDLYKYKSYYGQPLDGGDAPIEV
jgi:hypothetical protein